jgi:hypothetical protein
MFGRIRLAIVASAMVGGSGRCRGATATIDIEPSAGFSPWKRTFTIWP